ncbi:MAG: cysteine--tRNA ligase [Acidimicrobiales bacterium]|nr:cysteine--tRNA ligase [Acidimicrobiales bacterium]HLV89831.1 cysteine--tRNA ligase [Acidimicrobiia bacterium]
MIRVYNTLTRRLEDFETREPGKVGMYVCGPTVQSEPHVGHGRGAVAFDVIRRYLTWRGYEVTYVRNITDIEDKIIAAAAETGESTESLAERMGARFADAYRGLGVLAPDHEPKASEHIEEIIDLTSRLIDRGLAYASDGDVYFRVSALESYGKLSGTRPEELRAGYRIEVGESKIDPLDFALWKGAKPGEPYWESPWGPGRPGWHIECSAMAGKYLGNGFDIHGGGSDLIFPHHENEIAQSEGASGEPLARYWLHNGMVNLGGEKMSKSEGRVVDLATILSGRGGQAMRLLFLRAHYRSPIEYSSELLDDAEEALSRLVRFRERVAPGEPDQAALERFREIMDDDFSTPEAVSLMFDLVREGNRIADAGGDAASLAGAVEEIVAVLGIFDALPAPDEIPDVSAVAERFGVTSSGAEAIEDLIEMRRVARAERRFEEADAIRTALEGAGVQLEDGPDGTRWVRL